jgi:hypothetical protein
LSDRGFEFGEGHLDGIEIGTIGWEIVQGGAPVCYGFGNALDFVSCEVIADDHIALLQLGAKHLGEVGQEQLSIHGAIDQPRGADPVMPQGSDQGGCLPVTVRHRRQATLAHFRAAVEARHLGVQTGLIEKDQSLGLPLSLLFAPALAGGPEVLPVLLGGA